MNREYRGKSKEDGRWVYGCLVNNLWTYSDLTPTPGLPVCEIIETGEADDWSSVEYLAVEVFPESVGQWTGLKDKAGNDIYKGDIVKSDTLGHTHEIKFGYRLSLNYTGWYAECIETGESNAINSDYDSDINSAIKVIGNTYEHPHLIQKQ